MPLGTTRRSSSFSSSEEEDPVNDYYDYDHAPEVMTEVTPKVTHRPKVDFRAPNPVVMVNRRMSASQHQNESDSHTLPPERMSPMHTYKTIENLYKRNYWRK